MSYVKNERLEELDVTGEEYGIADLPPVPQADTLSAEDRHAMDLMEATLKMVRILNGSGEHFSNDQLISLEMEATEGAWSTAKGLVIALCRSQKNREAYILDTVDR